MDFDDTTDTSDSQAILALDFNNQATLTNQRSEFLDELDDNEVENNWPEDQSACSASKLAIPLPAPPTRSSVTDIDADTAFGGDLEALFTPTDDNSCDTSGDLIDVAAEAGVCGLKNLGNTCFMSTGVQCLTATPALVHCLLHQPGPKDSLTSHLSNLTHKMWSGHYSAVRPSDFKETLGAHYPQFKDFRQHDCQEFLALLLDGLHEEMNTSLLRNKLQDMLETDCDTDSCSKTTLNHVSNSLCKNVSPSHNNLKETNDSLRDKFGSKNEQFLEISRVDKKINNCVRSDTASACVSSKLPLISNKCDGDKEEGCVVMKNEQSSWLQNRTNDTFATTILNNCSQRLSGFEDIIKDAKTSNVNVLVTEQEANNEIKFDSDKFPKSEKLRRCDTFNVNSFQLYENNMTTSGKRGNKSTVKHYENAAEFREGLDLKRFKMQRNEHDQDECNSDTLMECDWEKNHYREDERKHRVSTKSLDKNYRMECERKLREGPGPSSVSSVAEAAQAETDQEAEDHWQKHLAANRSVIVDTFQGQFKSTVVCSKCNHISVTYEPFMYLSVPLPHAMECQLSVTFVSADGHEPVQYVLTVNKRDTVVSAIREQLLQMIGRPVTFLVLAEVLDHHIARILEENLQVRYINNASRSLYAFELVNFTHFSSEEDTEDCGKINSCGIFENESGDTCIVCLEESDSMYRHVGCACIVCDACLNKINEYGDKKCPVCRKVIIQNDYVSISLTPDTSPRVRMLNVSVVFRLDTMGDGNNNMRTVHLFGHPRLVRLPNRIQGRQLQEALASLIPFSQSYKILLVDGRGHHCSRCMYNVHCRGCPIDQEASLVLRAGDSFAAMFVEPVPELPAIQDSTTLHSTSINPLSLYDCIHAFSQSEVLDEHNPWYCPSCKQNQCATKTLSIWRYPNYLIIYLKRFVFQDCVSTKLDDKVMFPLLGLNMSQSSSLYDLYACVCHVGGVSAGHYTAYTQHPRSGEWHHYNDAYVTKQPPQEDDYSTAYILFYKKRGADSTNEDFAAKLVSLDNENVS